MALYVGLCIALVIALAPFISEGSSSEDPSNPRVFFLTFGLILCFVLGYWVLLVVQRVLPGFEVVGPSGESRGSRVLAVVGTLVLWATGIAVAALFTLMD